MATGYGSAAFQEDALQKSTGSRYSSLPARGDTVVARGLAVFLGKRTLTIKHPTFAGMGEDYPGHLEAQFDRVLTAIEELWDTPRVHDYFSDLLIDRRGGRKGFPAEVVQDLIKLREYRELETFRAAEHREDAARKLRARRIPMTAAAFLEAFRGGDQAVVDLFMRAGLPLPSTDQGEPLLLAALQRGHTIVAGIVLAAGANPNHRNKLGLTPLLVACGKATPGYWGIAEALIAKGAEVNVRDPLGNTPLMLALSGGASRIAELLMARGADVRNREALGVTRRSDAASA